MRRVYLSTIWLYISSSVYILNRFRNVTSLQPRESGLAYLGLDRGMLLSLSLAVLVNSRTFMRLSKKRVEEEPEYVHQRGYLTLIYGAISILIGLIVYCWTPEKALTSVIPYHGNQLCRVRHHVHIRKCSGIQIVIEPNP